MSVGAVEPAPVEPPESGTGRGKGGSGEAVTIGGSSRFVPGSHQQITVVNGKVQLRQRLKDLWHSFELLTLLVRSDLKIRYKSSVLGYLWSMLNPAMVLIIYYFIFKIIAKNNQPQFAIWLFCGLLVWNLFNNAALSSTNVVVGRAGIVKKVAFPRELLALSQVGVALVLFAIQAVVLVLALVLFGHTPDYQFLVLLPLALLGLIVFTSAVSIFLSAVNVYLRDTQHLTEVLLFAWFWTIPIVYTWGNISERLTARHLDWLKYVYMSDPLTPIAMTFQRAIYGKTQYTYKGTTTHILPIWGVGQYALILGVVLAVSIVLFLLSLIVFGRLEGNFAEEL